MNSKQILTAVLGPFALIITRYATWLPLSSLFTRLAYAYAGQKPKDFECKTTMGLKMTGNTKDLVDCHLFVFRQWEPVITDWIKDNLRQGDTFLDAGANIGYYSLLASEIVGKSGNVISIEASPTIAKRFKRNVEQNNCSNIRVINVAISDHAGTIKLYQGPPGNPAETTTIERGFELECEISCSPLSEMIDIKEFAKVRILKMDIEGAEWKALQGMKPLLANSHPELELITEVTFTGKDDSDGEAAKIINFLAEFGFNAYRIENEYTFAPYLRQGKAPRPRRVREPIRESCDLVFSHSDKDFL